MCRVCAEIMENGKWKMENGKFCAISASSIHRFIAALRHLLATLMREVRQAQYIALRANNFGSIAV